MLKRLQGSDLNICLESPRKGYWPPPPGHSCLPAFTIPSILYETLPHPLPAASLIPVWSRNHG